MSSIADWKNDLRADVRALDQKFDRKFDELHGLLVKAILGMVGYGIAVLGGLYMILERAGLF